ncbi:hypothetical protein [Cyclobacterium plantarum]|uniref:DNA polymerase III subunit gamma/tau n=1 Tax=Cyclobacterium plantarum TaxID=2716263 RepID=A0ABX0H2M9_9BACT|nr:hypothetical protein [Cyclobacterium plantarum]NHE55737.1 hypothetical protein [Cyclobacterium plantarum]
MSAVRNQIKERPLTGQVEKETKKQPVSAETTVKPIQELTEQAVQQMLEEVKHAFSEDHKNMEMALLKQPFEVRGYHVVFFLSKGIQEDLFSKLRPELTGILRRKLQHPELEVSFEVKEEAIDPSKNLYTSSEKLSFLLKKSPALKELKNRFGLETDF